MADATGKQLEVFVSKTEAELLSGEPNVLGLSSDRNTIVFNNKVVGSGANIHYKMIIINSSGTGWYRFAVNRGGFATQPSAIFCIERAYSSCKDEHYLFASTVNHYGNGNITQLTGYHNGGNGHYITKIRFAQKGTSPNTDSCFLDFYTTAGTSERYYVWIIGNWNALDIYKVDDEEEDQTYAYKVIETSLGFMPSEYTEFQDKLFGDLSVGTAAPTDAMYVVTNGGSGYETNWYKRPFSLVWSYIKSKIASVLGLTETSLAIGSHTEFKSDGKVEMQYGSTYGSYNKALAYQSYGGLASGVEGKPYAQYASISTLAMTVDGKTTYFGEALPSASLTYTYDGTEHSYTNSSTYTQWIVIVNNADFLGSGVFPFNKCYFIAGRILPDVNIASATELTEGSGTWQVVLTTTATSTNTTVDRTVSGELRALVASSSVTAYSTAAGRQSTIGGYYSTAFGYKSGIGAVNYANAFGIQSYCGGAGALAMGMYAIAVGQNSIAAGYRSYAKYNNSVALGYEAMALHAYATAFGMFTKTGRQYQTVLGYYNEGKSNTLLEVGYGSSTARKNVFEVTTDGVAKATRFEGGLGKHICTFSTSYVNAVVLLCKVDAWNGYMTLVGKIFTIQNGINRFASYDVAMHYSTGASSVYNSKFYLSGNSYDPALNFHLVQCTYNGEKWWALQKKGIQQTTMYFTGYDYNVSWEMIEYYNTNTATVLNEEINSSIVNCDDVLQLPTKTDGTKAVYEDKVLAQYLAKTVISTANSNTYTNQYTKFATIDVSGAAWDTCSGTIIMSGAENPIYGIASFLFRSGSAATVVNRRQIEWGVLGDANYADSIKVVMTTNNVYDLYFQPKDNYTQVRFEFISQYYEKITLHSNQSYVESIDAVVSSSLTGKVQSAQTATKATADANGNVITDTYVKSIAAKGGTLEFVKGDDTTESVAIPNHEVLQFDGIIADAITVDTQSVTSWSKIYWASSVGAFVAAVTTLGTDGTTTTYYGNFDNGTIRLADYTDNKLYRKTGTSDLYTLVDGTLTQTTAGSATIATKAVGDSVGNNIVNTYYSNVTASGNQLTFTKPSGSTKTVTIAKAAGLTYGSGIQRTEMIQCDSGGFTCISNSNITAIPAALYGMLWLNAGSDMVVSTPFAITVTQVTIPIKYMTDTTTMTWVDAFAVVKVSPTLINVIVRDASTGSAYGSVSAGTFKVQGYITGQFTES